MLATLVLQLSRTLSARSTSDSHDDDDDDNDYGDDGNNDDDEEMMKIIFQGILLRLKSL